MSFSLCYDPWVDKIFCSLGYRLPSRVALGIVVIMYCKLLMEYVYKKNFSTQFLRFSFRRNSPLGINAALRHVERDTLVQEELIVELKHFLSR